MLLTPLSLWALVLGAAALVVSAWHRQRRVERLTNSLLPAAGTAPLGVWRPAAGERTFVR